MKKTSYSISSVLANAEMRVKDARDQIIAVIETMTENETIELSKEVRVSLDNDHILIVDIKSVDKSKVHVDGMGYTLLSDLSINDLIAIANQMVMDVFHLKKMK